MRWESVQNSDRLLKMGCTNSPTAMNATRSVERGCQAHKGHVSPGHDILSPARSWGAYCPKRKVERGHNPAVSTSIFHTRSAQKKNHLFAYKYLNAVTLKARIFFSTQLYFRTSKIKHLQVSELGQGHLGLKRGNETVSSVPVNEYILNSLP